MRFPVPCLLVILAVWAHSRELPGVPDPVEPVPGPLMLCGSEGLSSTAAATLASLAEGKNGRLVIITTNTAKASTPGDLLREAVPEVRIMEIENRKQADSAEFIAPLEDATGVWLDDDISKLAIGTRLERELQGLAERAWVIGGAGRAAESLGTRIIDGDRTRPGFSLLPGSVVRAGEFEREPSPGQPETKDLVTWEIPPKGLMVVHEGRRVGVMGRERITARVAAHNGWPERVRQFGPPPVELPYTTDLLSWTRSAKARSGPVFPPADPPTPEVGSGTLILIGGGGSTDDMWERFIREAGGRDASFVCIVQSPRSTIAGKLRDLGCSKVTVLQSDLALRRKADSDEAFLKPLRQADGIFFGGGRTYRFMDAYQQTAAHRLMFEVLDRGGVIAGTSAGAQIQGDFLVRGDPRTNQALWFPGNDTGLGFLRGVIIDVHFAERERQRTLPPLLKKHPGMAGIGIDEATAIVIKGTTAEVLGRGSAWFYENRSNKDQGRKGPVTLESGGAYDLSEGKPIK